MLYLVPMLTHRVLTGACNPMPMPIDRCVIRYGGVLYVGDCITRTGNYAGHCPQMVLPSYVRRSNLRAALCSLCIRCRCQ